MVTALARSVYQKLSLTGSLYVMASTQSMPYLDLHLRSRMAVLSRIVWHYDSSGVQAKQYYGSLYEPILHAVVNRKSYTLNADAIRVEAKTGAKRKLVDYRKDVPVPYSTTKVPGNVWYFPRVRYRMSEYEEHPRRSRRLCWSVLSSPAQIRETRPDPFSGTFTTSAVRNA